MSESIDESENRTYNPELEDTREFTAEEIAELGLLIELAKRGTEADDSQA